MKEKDKAIQKSIKETFGIKVDPVPTRSKTQKLLRQICEDIWIKRGAEFKKVQQLSDLDLNFSGRGYSSYSLSYSIQGDDKFLVRGVSLEADMDYGAVSVLWISKITKKGVPSKRQMKLAMVKVEQRWFKEVY